MESRIQDCLGFPYMERLKTDLAILYNFGHVQEGHGASRKSDGACIPMNTYPNECSNCAIGNCPTDQPMS